MNFSLIILYLTVGVILQILYRIYCIKTGNQNYKLPGTYVLITLAYPLVISFVIFKFLLYDIPEKIVDHSFGKNELPPGGRPIQ